MNRFPISLIVAIAFVAGCENNRKYFPDGAYRVNDQHEDVQAANGALADGTLYARHFSGDKLNSLGQTKLSLMAQGAKSSTDTVRVFLDMPEAAVTELRKEVIKQFFAERGIIDERLAIAVGPNTGATEFATITSGKLYKTGDVKIDSSAGASTYGSDAQQK